MRNGTVLGMACRARRIAVINQKGGVGKTTTAVNLGVELATRGFRVLVVDFDAQRNATQFLGAADLVGWGSAEFVLGDASTFQPARDVCVAGLDLVPATDALEGVERALLGDLVSGARRLKRALSAIQDDYDFVLTDCGPTLGMMAINAIVGCPEVLVPVQLGHAAAMGALTLQNYLERIRLDIEPAVRLLGVLPTFLDERQNTPRSVLRQLQSIFGAAVFSTAIHDLAAIRAAAGQGRPVVLSEPRSRGAREYQALTQEVIERG